MSDDKCENGCVLPLRFPRRPGENPPTVHEDDCFCCAPYARISSDNRPALPHFNYRIGTYGTIREWLLHQINQTPKLKNWTHRNPDDPAIALLEGASILGDILTFYQETYANEAFLRTAQWRESISDLVRLLGYRLSPAIGGNAIFAFEIKKNEPVVIPAGFPIKTTLEEFPKPAEFETKAEITAYPWLSRFNLFKPLIQKEIEPSTTEFYISYPEQLLAPVELKVGDRLLMGEPVGSNVGGVSVEPTEFQIQAGEAAAAAILAAVQTALADADAALGYAQSSEAADSALIEMVGKVSEIAAGETAMQAVDEAIGRLVIEANGAWSEANSCKEATDVSDDSSTAMGNLLTTTANDRTLFPGVAEADLQSLIEMVDDEIKAVSQAAGDAVDKALESRDSIEELQTFIGDLASGTGTVGAAAKAARDSEAASKAADKAAIEAANKAVRLAVIAASSAAAGASDRVSASALASEADTLAGIAVTEAGQVKPAIDAAIVAAGAAFTWALASPVPGDPGAVGAEAIAVAKAADAVTEANQSATAVIDARNKIRQVSNALSASATAAAQKSINDRQAAVDAIGEADQLAGLAKSAADKMASDRAALVSKIHDALPYAVVAKRAAEDAIVAIEALIAAIRAVDSETVSESVMASGGAIDDAKNPARLKNAEIIIVDSVRELHGQKIFKIKGSPKRTRRVGKLWAYKLGRSFHHFGYNGPPTTTKTDEPLTSTATTKTENGKTTTTVTSPPIPEKNIAYSRFLGGITRNDDSAIRLPGNAGAVRIVEPPLGRLEFPLETEANDISPGMTMVIQTTLFGSPNTSKHSEFTMVRKIARIKPATQTWGLMTGSASMITLDKPLVVSSDGVRYRIADIRDFMLHEAVSPLLNVRRVKEETDAPNGGEINFYGTANEVKTLKNRRVMLEYPNGDPVITAVSEVPAAFDEDTYDFPQLHQVRLSTKVEYKYFPNENPIVPVFGNLADADEGKTMPEAVLGSGDATKVFQNFKVPKAPLTYHIVPENTPSETPEAEIYVDGRLWTKVGSFFERGAQEQIYIVREDAAGNSWVQFGDGKTGARLTNGTNNVTAIFRIGVGAYGPLKDDTKVEASGKLKNLDKIQMPMGATGGAPPEDGENARNAAPGKVQSLGRIVSLKDFEAEAAAIPGVARASAGWQLVDNVPAVVVTVLMETGRSAETNAVRKVLSAYNTLRGAGRTSIVVDLGKRMYVTVSLQYALQAGFRAALVEPEIRRALGVNFALPAGQDGQTGLFSLRQRRFGGREYSSSIEGVVQNVQGVVWAKTGEFTSLTDTDDPGSIALPSVTTLDPIVSCDAGHILSLYDKHLFLTAVTAAGR